MTAPIIYECTESAMVPLPRFHNMFAVNFTQGEHYKLEEVQERSRVSHNHYFACLHDAWLNLPEDIAERFPTAEHLRKYALIKTGYTDEISLCLPTHADALRVAAFTTPMDSYALILVSGNVVKRFTAQSQSMRAMGKRTFQESKTAVLDYIASLVGIAQDTLEKEAGRAA